MVYFDSVNGGIDSYISDFVDSRTFSVLSVVTCAITIKDVTKLVFDARTCDGGEHLEEVKICRKRDVKGIS